MTDKKTTQTFNQIPTDILDNKELGLLDKLIYGEVFTVTKQGNEFFMSNARLAERYGVTIRTVQRAIESLKTNGFITMKTYRNEQKMVTKRSLSVVTPVTPPSDTSDVTLMTPVTGGHDTSVTYNRSINRSTEYTNVHQDALESDFEKLWQLYPNKKGKELALKAYKKSIKAGATNKEIQNGIVKLKKEIAFKETDKKYIPHGGTWFNQKRWEDDYETGNVEQNNDYKTNEIARLENELQDDKLDPIERNFMSKKLAELKGSA